MTIENCTDGDEHGYPTDEQCDLLVARVINQEAERHSDEYGQFHPLDLNPSITANSGLRRAIVRAAFAERTEHVRPILAEPTEEMCDSVRGVLQILRGVPGATFANVRNHCSNRGDDLSTWPLWVADIDGYVTEQSAAQMIYEIMVANRPYISSTPAEKP